MPNDNITAVCPMPDDVCADCGYRCGEDRAEAEHLLHLAEFDRWEGMTDRQRGDEIRRAMQ